MLKYGKILKRIYDETNTYDPFEIARHFDTPVEYTDITDPPAKTVYLEDQPIILLSNKLRESNARYYICGHELGHIFKHTGIACPYDSNFHFRTGMEREADQFGFELCNALYYEENGYYTNDINQLSYSYGVPINFHLSETIR